MSYHDFVTTDRRLVILRTLAEQPDYSANSSVLTGLLDYYAHRVSRDQVDSYIAWLAEQGLVEVEDLKVVRVVTITNRGLDVAEGRVVVPGVRRPRPER